VPSATGTGSVEERKHRTPSGMLRQRRWSATASGGGGGRPAAAAAAHMAAWMRLRHGPQRANFEVSPVAAEFGQGKLPRPPQPAVLHEVFTIQIETRIEKRPANQSPAKRGEARSFRTQRSA